MFIRNNTDFVKSLKADAENPNLNVFILTQEH